MKATGEVMAIDRTFEAALQKAVRSLEFGKKSLLWEDRKWNMDGDINKYPLEPTDLRLWILMAALRRGITPETIAAKTHIDLWFLSKMQNIINMEKRLLGKPLTPELLLEAKRTGFSDEMIGTLADKLPEQVRELRHDWNIKQVYKMVDTCAAENSMQATPYFYSTYEKENEAISQPTEKGSRNRFGGPIRIGQGMNLIIAACILPGL